MPEKYGISTGFESFCLVVVWKNVFSKPGRQNQSVKLTCIRLVRGKDDRRNVLAYVARAQEAMVFETAAAAWKLGVPWANALPMAQKAFAAANPKAKAMPKGKAKAKAKAKAGAR